ncbi:MAG: response regulator transcription factor, partial [Gammaproteobacteria bacterium]|nr:response regulator transcription factor [Gammaproteobacteria bacterium]
MKILIADDHALFRQGLHYTLQTLGDDITIIEANNAAEVLNYVANESDIDLVLMDLDMPGIDGYSGLIKLRAEHPELPVAIVTASEYEADMLRVIDSGAAGYIPKSMSSNEMLDALRQILDGEVFVPDLSATSGTFQIRQVSSPGPMLGGEDDNEAAMEIYHRLTPRQRDVLHLMCEGMSNKVIAHTLGMAEGTVKIHVTAILKEMHATNRTQAVIMANEAGFAN